MESNRPATAAAAASHPYRATIALLMMALIWALNFSIAKDALARIAPLAFNTLRFPLAALVVTIAMSRRTGLGLPERADRVRLVGLGLLGNVVYQMCFIFGLDHTRAGTASVLLAGTPIVTGLLSAGMGHERIEPRTWMGAGATVLGITLVVLSGAPVAGSADSTLHGDLLMILATLAWAAYTVSSRPLISKYGALPVTAWTLWVGSTALVAIGIRSTLALDFHLIGPRDWFAVVYAGALSIGVAYVLWSYGIRHLGSTRTATFSNLVPVIALAAAWLLLSERPTAGQLTGAAVIIGGVTLVQLGRRRTVPSAPRIPAP